MRRDWLHVLVREREAVLGSARLSGACSRRARLHNKALKLARSASRVRGHSACTSRPRPGILLAQLKAKDVMTPMKWRRLRFASARVRRDLRVRHRGSPDQRRRYLRGRRSPRAQSPNNLKGEVPLTSSALEAASVPASRWGRTLTRSPTSSRRCSRSRTARETQRTAPWTDPEHASPRIQPSTQSSSSRACVLGVVPGALFVARLGVRRRVRPRVQGAP